MTMTHAMRASIARRRKDAEAFEQRVQQRVASALKANEREWAAKVATASDEGYARGYDVGLKDGRDAPAIADRVEEEVDRDERNEESIDAWEARLLGKEEGDE